MSSKFVIGDHIRVTNPKLDHFDRTGIVTEYHEIACEPASMVHLHGMDHPLGFKQTSLTLADSDVHTVLDEMDAESADPVSAPSHYTCHPSGIECIQVTEHMGFNLGSATKYLWRCDLKENAIQDLEKAVWYIQREIAKRKSAQ